MVTCPPDESVPTTTLPPASEYSRRNAATLAYPSRRPLTRGPDHTSLCLAGTNPSPGSLLICAASLRNSCPRGVAALHSATIVGLTYTPSFTSSSIRGGNCFGLISDSERSEERRVGKECRSWWSPDH